MKANEGTLNSELRIDASVAVFDDNGGPNGTR